MKILITGGAGFVGSLLAEKLQSIGHQVTIFDTYEYGSGPVFHLLQKGVECLRGDISDADQVAAEVKKTDFVFHLAGMVGFPLCQSEQERAWRINVVGTTHLNRAIMEARMFADRNIGVANASSGSVYGKIDDVCTEDSVPNPQSLYGKTKLKSEEILGGNAVHLRFATLCGASPCMRFDLLPNNLVFQARKQGFIVLYRGGDRRTFLSVGDSVAAYLRVLDKWRAGHWDTIAGKVINVGDESMNITKRQLADEIQKITGCIVHEQAGGVDPDFRDYEVKYERARDLLGFTASQPLPDMLGDVLKLVDITDYRGPWRFSL